MITSPYLLTHIHIVPCFFNFYLLYELSYKLYKNPRLSVLGSILDHTLSTLPFTLACFNYSLSFQNWVVILTTSFFLLNIVWINALYLWKYSDENNDKPKLKPLDPSSPSNYNIELSVFRGVTYVLTVICIFAVDLPAFPWQLRKTKFFGVGLMDLGVGLFVCHMGIKSVGQRWYKNVDKRGHYLRSTLSAMSILFVLGIIRLLLMKYSHLTYSYTEYGIHSNVFIVLGVVKILGFLLDISTTKLMKPGYVALILLVIHETALKIKLYSITTSIDPNSNRATFNIIMANIESIVSLPGLVALYMAAKQIGLLFFKENNHNFDASVKKFWKMSISGVIIAALNQNFIFIGFIKLESRRLANWSYVVMLVSLYLLIGGVFVLRSGYLYFRDKNVFDQKCYLEKVDECGLTYFLLGNVLVGVLRLVKNYFHFPNWSGSLVTFMYCSFLFVIVMCLKKLFPKLK